MRLTSLFNFLTHILDTFCFFNIVPVAHIIRIQISTRIAADNQILFWHDLLHCG